MSGHVCRIPWSADQSGEFLCSCSRVWVKAEASDVWRVVRRRRMALIWALLLGALVVTFVFGSTEHDGAWILAVALVGGALRLGYVPPGVRS